MKPVPVTEVFGPTIQGEGPDAGLPVKFVRFGGCDYSCSWCDSLHAVIPAEVRKAPKLDEVAIADQLDALESGAKTIVLSGGNPALHDLTDLVRLLFERGYRTTVETQGSRFQTWLLDVDLVVCSPKPPSSGMVTDWEKLDLFVGQLRAWNLALKVVVGDEHDYLYARLVHARYPRVPFYLSVLNPAGSDIPGFDVDVILSSYRDLCERVAVDPAMFDARVMPQMHTLAWGAAKGV